MNAPFVGVMLHILYQAAGQAFSKLLQKGRFALLNIDFRIRSNWI
jgi:hypothetical protein